jgi:hypothetical protein
VHIFCYAHEDNEDRTLCQQCADDWDHKAEGWTRDDERDAEEPEMAEKDEIIQKLQTALDDVAQNLRTALDEQEAKEEAARKKKRMDEFMEWQMDLFKQYEAKQITHAQGMRMMRELYPEFTPDDKDGEDSFTDNESDDEGNEWFDRKYANASCHRCNIKLNGDTVVFCGVDDCETWYCRKCSDEGTDDCPVCMQTKIQEQKAQIEELERELKTIHEIVQCKRPNAEMEFGEHDSTLRFIFSAGRLQIYTIAPDVLQEIGTERLEEYFNYDTDEPGGCWATLSNHWAEFHPLSVRDVELQEQCRSRLS